MSVWTWLTDAITAVAAVGLLSMGVVVALRKTTAKAAAVTALLSFGFLTLVLLQISKFKHINGFGFEAETWDQKQVEAARLVDELSKMSAGLSQQVALLASRLGLWGSGLSNPELASLLRNTETILETANVPEQQREEIVLPIRERISLNYWQAAHDLIALAYDQQYKDAHNQSTESIIVEDGKKFGEITSVFPHDLVPLITSVKEAKAFKASPKLLADLDDLDKDLRYFTSGTTQS